MSWLLYGANGFTGRLVAERAREVGEAPVLAGRNEEAVARLARDLELAYRVFPLDDPAAVWHGLEGVSAVLACAGPFAWTSRPLVEACLASGSHYLDITGEIGVLEAVLRRGADARAAGVALLPGVGFDVVPTDCLAARLAAELPDGTELELAFAAAGGSWSRGTLRTAIEGLPAAGAVRRRGRLVSVPLAWQVKEIPFDHRRLWAVTIPWGDLATAFASTGIPDIRVYSAMPLGAVRRLRWLRPLLPLVALGPVKRWAQRRVDARVTGPDAATRERARMHLWGRVADAAGNAATATATTPEGYRFTALAAVECVRRACAGEVGAGAWTPSAAFGADFAGTLPGVEIGPVEHHPIA